MNGSIPLTLVSPRPVPRPRTVNFQVNDICNARCVMCNIWQHKRGPEMSPDELAVLLSDPYFSDVEHVGITGGEPTLKHDLADYYAVLPEVCSRLTGASFITHGLDYDRILPVYTQVAETYRARGLEFHGMVSLDGIGTVHDRVRGRAGAFERATRTLFGLKASGIPTSACCTIVRSNVWDVQNLLEWGYDKTYIRFRVAEFINRLHNHDATLEIRAFDDAERAVLISFFQSLIECYEPDEMVRRTYASIVSLLAGGTRLVGCPYQDGHALNLDCRGHFAVCAPKGTPRALAGDGARAVAAAAAERGHIAANHCHTCIHDYHDDWRPEIAARHVVATEVIRQLAAPPGPAAHSSGELPSRNATLEKVLVLGWYGTETIGDLAILAGLVDEYRRDTPGVRFVIPSQFPDYTRHNMARMGLDCRVAAYGDPELVGELWNCGTVIIGGGPLMDIPQLRWLATIFERARRQGRRTVVDGCGIGPVHLPETAVDIRRIAAAADEIRVRDRASARRLRALGVEREVEVVEDPAARWVRTTKVKHHSSDSGAICVFARELTHEYPQPTSSPAATGIIAAFARNLCDWFPGHQVELHAMHHFPVGGDDRVYARRLATLIDRPNTRVDEVPRTPRETLDIMAAASLVVGMRFHSVVFADVINAPLVAIDYTNGGKVADYLLERGLDDRCVSLARLGSLGREQLATLLARQEEVLR